MSQAPQIRNRRRPIEVPIGASPQTHRPVGGSPGAEGVDPKARLTIAIVCEHASARCGGESILPLHYVANLTARGHEVHLVVHERARDEVAPLFDPGDARLHLARDTKAHRVFWRIGRAIPMRIRPFTTGFLERLCTVREQRRIVRRLVLERGVQVVHEPTPVSPRTPSGMVVRGVPVVIGPMNGGMRYPPAFRAAESLPERLALSGGRLASGLLNRLIPGKRRAATLLVANQRSRNALPPARRPRVETMDENGVDDRLWGPVFERRREATPGRMESGPVRFVFSGRLIRLKALDIAIDAFAEIASQIDAELHVVGDGEARAFFEQCAEQRGVADRVRIHGWLPQRDLPDLLASMDVMVMPSLCECGGAVVLEAMALGLPVIATDWGGPADYVTDACGVLVEPESRAALVRGFADAMRTLAQDPARRRALGEAGRARVEDRFTWSEKSRRIEAVYREAIARSGATADRAP